MLLGKIMAIKAVGDVAGKGVRKVEKKVDKKLKKIRRRLVAFLIVMAFIAGCSLTGYVVYQNSDRIAARVNRINRRRWLRRVTGIGRKR